MHFAKNILRAVKLKFAKPGVFEYLFDITGYFRLNWQILISVKNETHIIFVTV